MMEKKYWPFPVIPPERRTEQHKRELRFFDAAHARGIQSFMFEAGFGAESEGGRYGLIFRRGPHRWEVAVGIGDKEHASAFHGDFDRAAEEVLRWFDDVSTP